MPTVVAAEAGQVGRDVARTTTQVADPVRAGGLRHTSTSSTRLRSSARSSGLAASSPPISSA